MRARAARAATVPTDAPADDTPATREEAIEVIEAVGKIAEAMGGQPALVAVFTMMAGEEKRVPWRGKAASVARAKEWLLANGYGRGAAASWDKFVGERQ